MVIDLVKDYHDKIPKRTQENTSADDSGMTQGDSSASDRDAGRTHENTSADDSGMTQGHSSASDRDAGRTHENSSTDDSGRTQEEVAADPNLTTVVNPGALDHDHELQDINGAETDKGACKEPNSSTSAL